MNDVKKILKKVAPKQAKSAYRRLAATKESVLAFSYDKQRFLRHNAGRGLSRSNEDQLNARITFHAHALEKGLSHRVIRLGFGGTALKALAGNMQKYIAQGYSKKSEAYQNALSVLKSYIAVHEKEKFDFDLSPLFSAEILKEARGDTSKLGGISIIKSESKTVNSTANFKDLFSNRWSVREYSDKPVDVKKIDEVIEIARKTPSICNRQASRVTVMRDQKVIADVLKLQGGITGYELPPALLMVTTDTAAFLDVNERNQVYIDGGLYAMAVLMGLEYVSLGACPLNAMLSVKNDKKMRKLLDIPASENIIMFISVGNFLEENKVPRSFRYSKEAVSRKI